VSAIVDPSVWIWLIRHGGFNIAHAQEQSHTGGQQVHGNMAATSPADEDQEARTRDEEDHEARTGDEVQLAHALRHYDEVERGDHNGDDDQEGCRDWNDDDDAGDHSDGEHGDGGPKGSERDLVDTIDMAVEFSTAPDSDMHHYFIILDAADPEVIEQVGGLDPIVDEPMSIT
jgi:hypothetical protein